MVYEDCIKYRARGVEALVYYLLALSNYTKTSKASPPKPINCYFVLLIDYLYPLACQHGVILEGASCGDCVLEAVWMTAVSAGGAQDQRHQTPAGQ